MKIKICLLYVSLCLLVFQFSADFVSDVLQLRLKSLRRFAEKGIQPNRKCSSDRFIIITEYPFGRTGNQILSFTNGVYFADKLNSTLVIPNYMHHLFESFNTSVTSSLFCYTLSGPPNDAKKIEITSEEMFFGFQVFSNAALNSDLGPFTDATRVDLSKYLLRVYSSLWGNPHQKIVSAAEHIIRNYLNGNFQYSSVHLRQLEGGCSKVMAHVTKPSDFSPTELPMTAPEWHTNLHKWHPLCDMDYNFVNAVLEMHKRNSSKIFAAHDAHSDISAYRNHGAVFSSHIQEAELKSGYDVKYLDMFMCIHSDFFVLNPRSTFSLQIMVVRLLLSLSSVPSIKDNDIFLQKVPEDLKKYNRSLWITRDSLIDAILND